MENINQDDKQGYGPLASLGITAAFLAGILLVSLLLKEILL